ncbi:putative cyclin d [Tripterygium wilfordii]|uniref:B-like cyclin n=1 Tax=Tripterygium wilfordii TaxID=458696 RepID=A0A7J7CZD2_TRIWF|nr:cyclin-D5-2-like [Tripterygium wilfordii]KAF5739471.1 putative cyclin d [Tripterygium wilfordii]
MDDESLPGLLCQESMICLTEDVADKDAAFVRTKSSSYGGDSDEEDMFLKRLVDREKTFGFNKGFQSVVLGDWLKCARLEAISLILKTRTALGFCFQTAYLAVAYMDRFLVRRPNIDSEQSWAIPLLSVACLSLAAKMEEVNVPTLSDYQVEEYRFDSRVIQRMELLVLNILEWRMCTVTPFPFLHYFISTLCNESSSSSHVLSRTAGFIFANKKGSDLIDHHRSSVVAYAATLMALDQTLTRPALEIKINSVSSLHELLEIDTESVVSCYNLMQKLEIPEFEKPPLLPSDLSPIDVVENSSVTFVIGTKRRRFTFSDSDQIDRLLDEKRLR